MELSKFVDDFFFAACKRNVFLSGESGGEVGRRENRCEGRKRKGGSFLAVKHNMAKGLKFENVNFLIFS